jgi:RNA recognition motif-containing protein
MMNYPKVFLGGLPANVNETNLREFFSKYGRVSIIQEILITLAITCHFVSR